MRGTFRSINKDGYMMVYDPGYHRAMTNGYVLEHIYVAETITGITLKSKNKLHHIDGNRLNNSPNNLVICEDDCYHQLIHLRYEALKATGDPNLLWCSGCKEYFTKESFTKDSKRKSRGCNCYCKKCNVTQKKLNSIRNPNTIKKYKFKNQGAIKAKMRQYHINRTLNETSEEKSVRLEKARIATAKYRMKKKEIENGAKTYI